MKGAPFYPSMISIRSGVNTDQLTGSDDNGGPPNATQNQQAGQRVPTDPVAPSQSQSPGQRVRTDPVTPNQSQSPGRRVRTDPVAPNPTQNRYLGVGNAAGGFPFFSGGAIYGGRCPRLLDYDANLTSRHSVNRTSAWNPIARAVGSGSLWCPC